MEWTHGQYVLTDDKTRIDFDATCSMLAETYWAADRPRRVMEEAVENSLCLGLFHDGRQVGFSRAVTDYATFTWICDVIVHPEHRGQGLGTWMVRHLIEHPQLQTRSQVLRTKDAHGLYERFGFLRTEYMVRKPAAPHLNSSAAEPIP